MASLSVSIMHTLLLRVLSLMALLLGLSATPALAQNAPAANAGQADYVLGAGDVIKISVYQSPDLTLETRVSETGVISYPLLGQVKLGGLSISAAEKKLADGLVKGNFLRNPQVSVLVVTVRGNQASVLGAVNKPGRFPLETSGLRLTDLLALAGGISPTGSDVVTLTGRRDGKTIRQDIDVPDLFGPNSMNKNPLVMDGDVIYVDRMPTVYIYGEVQRPGAVRLERGMTVMQALAAGGGVTARGTERGMRVNRMGPDGKIQELQPAMNDLLQNGDVIYVRQSLF